MKTAYFLSAAWAVLCPLSGIDNLFPNPGFESWHGDRPTPVSWRWGIEGKSASDGRPIFERIEQSFQKKRSGKASLHLSDTNNGALNNVYTYSLAPSEIKKLEGKVLTFSAWVKQIRSSSAKKVGIGLLCVTKKDYTTVGDWIDDSGETPWTHLLVRKKIPADTTRIVLRFFCANHFGQTAEAFFDDVLLTTDPVEKQHGTAPEPITNSGSIMTRKFLLPVYPSTPSAWTIRARGGFELTTPPGKAPRLELKQKKSTAKAYGQIICETKSGNRHYDFSSASKHDLVFSFLYSENVPVRMELYSGQKRIRFVLKNGTPEGDGMFRYTAPLPEKPTALRSIVLNFPPAEGKKALFGDAGFQAPASVPSPVYAAFPDGEDFKKRYEQPMIFKTDSYVRPEIRNGTWYRNGTYEFLLGPWIYNRNSGWGADKKYNPLGIDHIAYTTPPGKKVFDAMGFNAAQMSAAPKLFCMADFGLGVPADVRKQESDFKDFAKGFGDLYFVADFAFSPDRELAAEFPEKYRKLDQRFDGWHSFVPLCPESPEGEKYYTALMEGGTKIMLKSGLNVGVYELFNESVYGCQCSYNAKAFSRKMQEKYGTVEHANKQWGTCFSSFEELGRSGDLRSYRGLWVEWWQFLAGRYGEILKKYSALVRKTDQRPNVYFTEMLAINSIWNGFMDYRIIADSLDLLATEGGLKYGHAGLNVATQTDNGMETVVFSGTQYWYICDFFQALAKGKKPVINDEHYCWRSEYGLRAPSKRTDMTTSLWNDLMHGSSGNFTYVLDKRQFDYKTPEQAKQNVIQISYKSSSLLNPYNWPPEELVGFKNFRDELEPYREQLLPFPRTKAPTVAVYHSYITHAMANIERNFNFKDRMLRWYFAAFHQQYPMTFVFDSELMKGEIPTDIQAILIPCADYENPAVLQALEKFIQRGGVVIADKNAFRFDSHARKMNPAPSINGIIRLDSSSPDSSTRLTRILEEKKIRRYGIITPIDGGKPLTGADVQIIDRGDFKFIYLVNMADLIHRKIRLSLDLNVSGTFYLTNPLTRRLLVPESGETWSEAELRRGIELILPPQERVLLTLERKKPAKLSRYTIADQNNDFEKHALADRKITEEYDARMEQKKQRAASARKMPDVHPERCRPADLRHAANMDIRDIIGGDRKGGAFDQGKKDFSNLPHGKHILADVPFELMNPVANHRKAMLVLAGRDRDYFPMEIKNIALTGKAKKLYFLHTMGWGGPKGDPILTYRVHYSDRTHCDIPVRSRMEIAPWMDRSDAEPPANAKIALETINGEGDPINLQCFRWNNPHPEKELKQLEIRSACGSGVPAVFAVTLEE